MRFYRIIPMALILSATTATARSSTSDKRTDTTTATSSRLAKSRAKAREQARRACLEHDRYQAVVEMVQTVRSGWRNKFASTATFYCTTTKSEVLATLPKKTVFRTHHDTFNPKYRFSLRFGQIWLQRRDTEGATWELLEKPSNLYGVREITSDDEYLMATDYQRSLFTMKNGLSSHPWMFDWTDNWGAPLWKGEGIQIPEHAQFFDASFFSPKLDRYYRDPVGNRHSIGLGITNLYYLTRDGRQVVFLDPWLPSDDSYRFLTPRTGSVQAVALSASGSRVFIIDGDGHMYTRLFDFDQAGGDTLFFRYSYKPQQRWPTDRVRTLADRQLPSFAWQQLPDIRGVKLTDRITVIKSGEGGENAIFRVEGTNRGGAVGYYELQLTKLQWAFTLTGAELGGSSLESAARQAQQHDHPIELRSYAWQGHHEGVTGILVRRFHPFDSPASMTVHLEDGTSLAFVLHITHPIRQRVSEPGLTESSPLKLLANTELLSPPASLSASQERFIEDVMSNQTFRSLRSLEVTTQAMDINLKGYGPFRLLPVKSLP